MQQVGGCSEPTASFRVLPVVRWPPHAHKPGFCYFVESESGNIDQFQMFLTATVQPYLKGVRGGLFVLFILLLRRIKKKEGRGGIWDVACDPQSQNKVPHLYSIFASIRGTDARTSPSRLPGPGYRRRALNPNRNKKIMRASFAIRTRVVNSAVFSLPLSW